MYCIKCGTSNEEDARFCSFCGEAMTAETVSISAKEENAMASLETATAEPTAKAATDAPTAPESVSYAPEAATLPSAEERRRKRPLGIVLGVMSGTAVALFGVIVYLLARDGHF